MSAAAWVFLAAFIVTGLLLACTLLGAADQNKRAQDRICWLKSELDRANHYPCYCPESNVVPFRTDQKDRIAGRIAANQARRTNWGDVFRPAGQDGA